jgi:hypothetical protein
VEPRSVSLASAVRALAEEALEEPLFGVEKRLSAVVREELAPELEVPLDDALVDEPDEDDAEEDEEDEFVCEELVEVEEEDDDDELPEEEGWKVGVLEIALVLAREAEGSEAVGDRRVPRSRGTIMAA